MTKERRKELRALSQKCGYWVQYQVPVLEARGVSSGELRALLDSDERLEQKQVRIVVLEEQIAALPKAWKGRAEAAEAELHNLECRAINAEAERDALKAKLEEALKAWDYEYAKRTQAEDAWEVLRAKLEAEREG